VFPEASGHGRPRSSEEAAAVTPVALPARALEVHGSLRSKRITTLSLRSALDILVRLLCSNLRDSRHPDLCLMANALPRNG
jgi:hypothetical protein